MTDEEIVQALKTADGLLEQYKATLRPVLDALANRKSVYVFGEPDHYRGEFGCFEEGADSLCIHIKDIEEIYGLGTEEQGTRQKAAYRFEDEWREKTSLKHVYIRGHL